jgi:hypothetical protein
VLAGCGNGAGSGAAKQVASLPGATGSAGRSAAAAGTQKFGLQGPTLPDNASLAQMKRIVNPWFACLEAHGDHAIGSKGPGILSPSGPIPAAAAKACQRLRPHPPWQEIPADNPQYNKDFATWVNCMNARGMSVRAVPGGWNFNSANEPADADKIQVQCEMQAFGEH